MIPYGRQTISEADIAAVTVALRSDYLTQGPLIAEFERRFAARVGSKHAVAACNATAALHLALTVAGIGPGDRVVTSPNTFLASANCAAYVGATPDFADIDPVSYTIDPVALEKNWRDDTRAVVAVDFAGQTADLPSIARVARARGAIVIEDACHAVGGAFEAEGRLWNVGGNPWADVAVFSFHPVKTLTTGEGGMLVTDRADWAERARRLRSHGIERVADNFTEFTAEAGPWLYEQQELGFNYRLTDLQCALGISQLDRLDAVLVRRREIVAAYNAAFAGLDWIKTPGLRIAADASSTSWHLYTVQIDFPRLGRSRVEVMATLREAGVGTQVHYIPVHLQPWYRRTYGYGPGQCPVAEEYYKRTLSLPLFPAMTDAEVETVIASVRSLQPGLAESFSAVEITPSAVLHAGPQLAHFKGLTIIDCEHCGYAHLDPMPDRPAKPEYYAEDFYEKAYPNYIANGTEDSPWLQLEARTQYQEFESFLPAGMPRTLLDIGSGPGYFLLSGAKRDWNVRGVEPARAAWRHSVETLGLEVLHGYFPSPAVAALPPAAVTNCKKVLEHVADPLAFLLAMKEATMPGGLICVSVPNEFNPLQQAFVQDTNSSAWWVCEEHCNYFTPASLTRLAERAGLETLRVATDFPMELFLLMGDNYTVNETLGRACHQRRKSFELALDRVGQGVLRAQLYESFARCGIGRMVTYLGRVPAIHC